MAPGTLDAVTKEMVYLAVSVTNGCGYCIASHGAAARKAGMTEAMFGELMAVVGMANETNRLANGYRVPIDPRSRNNEQRSVRRKENGPVRNRGRSVMFDRGRLRPIGIGGRDARRCRRTERLRARRHAGCGQPRRIAGSDVLWFTFRR